MENYLGHFLEKLQKIWNKYNKLPAKGAREARPFVAEAICYTFFILFAIFPKIAQVVFHKLAARTCLKRMSASVMTYLRRRGACHNVHLKKTIRACNTKLRRAPLGRIIFASLSKVFGFLRFSSPQAVKTPPGPQKGGPNPKLGSPDAGRNLAKNRKN